MRKRERGITLIALVVTIVVLLILAAVSISMLGGENGIITQAQNAKLESRAGEVEERVNLWKSEKISSKYTNATVKTEDELLDEMKTDKILFEEEIDRENKIITIGSREISYAIENDYLDIPDINSIYNLNARKVKDGNNYYLKYDLINIENENVEKLLYQQITYIIKKYNITGTEEEQKNEAMLLIMMKSINNVSDKKFQTTEEFLEYMNSLTQEEQMSLLFKVALQVECGGIFLYQENEIVNIERYIETEANVLGYKISDIPNLTEDKALYLKNCVAEEIKTKPIYISRFTVNAKLWENNDENLIEGLYLYDRYTDQRITEVENVQINFDNKNWEDITEYYKNTEDGYIDFYDLKNAKGEFKIKFTKNNKEYLYEGKYCTIPD